MKLRESFVTNSSSSSFIIKRKDLTATQFDAIQDHTNFAENRLGWKEYDCDDPWSIDTRGDSEYGSVCGNTWMDNFDMYSFMEAIGVDMTKVKWESD